MSSHCDFKPEVGRREEPEILAARVPHRPHRVGQAVGHLLRFAGLDVADEDRVIERVAGGSRRRPTSSRGSTTGFSVRVGTIHGSLPTIFALPLATSMHPDVQVGVGVEQLLRIGRPGRRVVVRRLLERDLARRRRGRPALRCTSLYSPDLSLKYETNLPSGDHAGSRSADPLELREVAHVALLRRNREDLAARFDDHALAGRRERRGSSCALVTSSQRGIIHGKSPVAVIVHDRAPCRVFGSSSWM